MGQIEGKQKNTDLGDATDIIFSISAMDTALKAKRAHGHTGSETTI